MRHTPCHSCDCQLLIGATPLSLCVCADTAVLNWLCLHVHCCCHSLSQTTYTHASHTVCPRLVHPSSTLATSLTRLLTDHPQLWRGFSAGCVLVSRIHTHACSCACTTHHAPVFLSCLFPCQPGSQLMLWHGCRLCLLLLLMLLPLLYMYM